MKPLFDASALLNIIRALGAEALKYIFNGYILDLTLYEVGNALWKEATLLKRISFDEALTLLRLVESAVNKAMIVVTPHDKSLALRLAHELNITYYDSSYIVSASELDVILVTDDRKLRERILENQSLLAKVLGKGVKVYSTAEFIKMFT